jgi:hypothetical protein
MAELAVAILQGAVGLQVWLPEHDEAVRLLTEARGAMMADEEMHGLLTAVLGMALNLRSFARRLEGVIEAADDGIALLEEALARPGLDGEVASFCRLLVALALVLRATVPTARRLGPSIDLTIFDQPSWWHQPGAAADLERARLHLETARMAGPLADNPDVSAIWALVRTATVVDALETVVDVELDELIDGLHAGRHGSFGDTLKLAGFGALRGALLGERARRTGNPTDADHALEVLREADRELPSGSLMRPFVLGEIGRLLSASRDATARYADPDSQALDALVDMVELAGTHRPTVNLALDRLADAVLAAQQGRPVGLRVGRVINALRSGLTAPPPDTGRLAAWQAALGVALAARWRTTGDRSDLEAAKAHLTEAGRTLLRDDDRRFVVILAAAWTFTSSGLLDGDRSLVERAIGCWTEVRELLAAGRAPTAVTPAGTALVADMLAWADHLRMLAERPHSHRAGLLELWCGVAGMPDDEARRRAGADLLGFARLASAAVVGGRATVRSAVADLGQTSVSNRPDSAAEASAMIQRGLALSNGVLVGGGAEPASGAVLDVAVLDQAADLLEAGLSVELPDESARPAYLAALGRILLGRHRLTGERAVLDRAVQRLEQSRTVASNTPTTGEAAAALVDLAVAYRTRNDPRNDDRGRAVNAGHGALRAYAQAVLLGDTVADRLALARSANVQLARLAGWCLEDADPGAAVVLLEAGRGLLLHAATMSATVPHTLRETGHAALADAWERGSGADSAVRSRALDALARSIPGLRLLATPEAWGLASTVWAHGSDALVYLLPASPEGPGRAVVVRHQEAVEHLDLPGLVTDDGSPLARYTAARRVLAARPGSDNLDVYADPDGQRWLASLDELCTWAWDAAVGPLLGHLARWGLHRPPRLVIIPTGALGAVPWHAARRPHPDGRGGWRYGCEDAVLSYAASGRLLGDAVRRTIRPPAAEPAFVANPTGTQVWASIGAEAIRDSFYPGTAFLGHPRGDACGTREEVLGLMPAAGRPGASLLQLSTHARAEEPPTQSRLYLAEVQHLTVEEILAQTSGRPQAAPGGLVICDACTTDLTEQDHDEALTLGTAFIAAGYASAIGTRWPVADRATAILMYVFHHHLRDGGDTSTSPGDALRRTQLWALDPGRRAPAGMPANLARYVSDEKLADVYAWAAFAHHGR